MFEVVNVNLGKVRVHSSNNVVFPFKGIKIHHMIPSCGCAVPKIDESTSSVIVNYTAKDIPPHLVNKGQSQYKTSKDITVNYTILNDPDTTMRTIVLGFTALVYKPEK